MNKKIISACIFLLALLAACDVPDLPTQPVGVPSPTPTQDQANAKQLVVVYVGSDRNVYRWYATSFDPNLPPTQQVTEKLTYTGDVSGVRIASDGKFLAYTRSFPEGDELWVRDLTAPIDPFPIVSQAYLEKLNPSDSFQPKIISFNFIPNDHEVWVNIQVSNDMQGFDIYRVSVENPNIMPVRLLPPGVMGKISFSFDGEWFTVSTTNSLILSNTTSTESYSFFRDYPPSIGLGYRGGPDVVWSSDSQGFFVVTPTYIDGVLYGESTLWWIAVNDPKPVEVLDFVAQMYHPSFISPNGKKVAILLDFGDTSSLAISDGNDPREFLTDSTYRLGLYGWAPVVDGNEDSNCLVYWQDTPQSPLMECDWISTGFLTNAPVTYPDLLRWTDPARFLYITSSIPNTNHLYLETWDKNLILIDFLVSVVGDLPPYDFINLDQ